jgi:glycine cleavage system pyridoxal-binding protein P
MEFVVFAGCFTIIVAFVLYAYHQTHIETVEQVRRAYDRAAEFQNGVLQEARAMREQVQAERTQSIQERTNIMGMVNNCVTALQQSNARHDAQLTQQFESLSLDLLQRIGDATADALQHTRGERVGVGGSAGQQKGAKKSDS